MIFNRFFAAAFLLWFFKTDLIKFWIFTYEKKKNERRSGYACGTIKHWLFSESILLVSIRTEYQKKVQRELLCSTKPIKLIENWIYVVYQSDSVCILYPWCVGWGDATRYHTICANNSTQQSNHRISYANLWTYDINLLDSYAALIAFPLK